MLNEIFMQKNLITEKGLNINIRNDEEEVQFLQLCNRRDIENY